MEAIELAPATLVQGGGDILEVWREKGSPVSLEGAFIPWGQGPAVRSMSSPVAVSLSNSPDAVTLCSLSVDPGKGWHWCPQPYRRHGHSPRSCVGPDGGV